jgi:hypothetical protein
MIVRVLMLGAALALLPAAVQAQSIPGALPESAKALAEGANGRPMAAPMPPRAIRR